MQTFIHDLHLITNNNGALRFSNNSEVNIECFLVTTCTVICLTCTYHQLHNSVLSVAKVLKYDRNLDNLPCIRVNAMTLCSLPVYMKLFEKIFYELEVRIITSINK